MSEDEKKRALYISMTRRTLLARIFTYLYSKLGLSTLTSSVCCHVPMEVQAALSTIKEDVNKLELHFIVVRVIFFFNAITLF